MLFITSCVTAKAQSIIADDDHAVFGRDYCSELAMHSKVY